MLQLLKYSRNTRVCSVFKGKLEVEEKRLPGNNKYAPCIELECAEASVPHSEIQRPHLAGLGYNVMHASTYNLESVRKSHISKYIYDVDVTQQLTHLSSLQMQGCWNQWDNIMNTDFSWRNKLIYGTSDGVLRFLLNSTTNTLPTPDNLRRWGVSRVELSCVLCHRVSTLRHILTGCPVALHQGRHTWRHNSVLSVIQQSIITSWNAQKDVYANTLSLPYIEFVKPGLKPSKGHSRKQLLGSLLSGSLDWVFLFDLEESSIFPSEIAFTTLRPDGVIFSHKLKTVIRLELTVPIEDRVITVKFIKSKRYDSLIRECQSNG